MRVTELNFEAWTEVSVPGRGEGIKIFEALTSEEKEQFVSVPGRGEGIKSYRYSFWWCCSCVSVPGRGEGIKTPFTVKGKKGKFKFPSPEGVKELKHVVVLSDFFSRSKSFRPRKG